MARPKAGLTPKQAAFVREYLVDLDATGAARRAGYRGRHLHVAAHHLLHETPAVKAAIDDALARRAARVEVRADEVLRTLLRVLNSDIRQVFDKDGKLLPIHQWPDDVAFAIGGVDLDEQGRLRKVKAWSKDRAIELGLKHLGLLVDKREISVSGTVTYQVNDPFAVPREESAAAATKGNGHA